MLGRNWRTSESSEENDAVNSLVAMEAVVVSCLVETVDNKMEKHTIYLDIVT
jgi:hypothetical protein